MNQTTLIDEPVEGEVVSESRELATQSIDPMTLIQAAITQGVDTDKLEKLLELQERWESGQARKAYNAAMAEFRKNHITVLRSTTVNDGPLKGNAYAKLIDFVSAATPALSACGLNATWEVTRDEKDWIEVACMVKHIDGHFETTKMGGPPDSGGAKNPIQARASTVTYLQKYTLKMALGLAEQGDDNDGNGTPELIDEKQLATLDQELQRIAPDERQDAVDALFKWAGISVMADLPASKYRGALAALMKRSAKYQ